MISNEGKGAGREKEEDPLGEEGWGDSEDRQRDFIGETKGRAT